MSERFNFYVKRFSILLVMLALIVGMEGCIYGPRDQYLEIRDWYDLNEIRNNLSSHHILMNDLDSTTDGYEELASPTANEGKGWHPIGGPGTGEGPPFTGILDGQGYEIRDLFIDLPGIGYVGLFSIVGDGGSVENIGVVNADVTCTAYVGGLVGANRGTVSNSYSTGSVTGDEDSGWVGGLVGFNEEGTVSNSYSTGSVTGDYGVGGLMGSNEGTVSNSYSTGNVTGEEGVGGLIGANRGTVSNSYSAGSVSGNDDFGGLMGYSDGTVSNSFWDTETSGQATSAGGTGKTTIEMKSIATFSGAAWEIIAVASGFTNPSYIWNIVDDETYPFLSWQS
jgi:hypothetical protein